MTRSVSDFYSHPAGTVRRLTKDIEVTIGAVNSYPLHPSGKAYGDLVVIVSAHLGTLGHPLVKIVSLTDPTFRVVVASASIFAA